MRSSKNPLLLGLIGLALLTTIVSELRAESAISSTVICSQNLNRYGEKSKKQRDLAAENQLAYLVNRIRNAHCDIVAVQEVVGDSKAQAGKTLAALVAALAERTGRHYEGYVGEGRDKYIRNGFLVDTAVFEVIKVESFNDQPLPRYRALGPPNYFQRAPLGLLVRSKQAPSRSRQLFILNNHFKSKAFSYKDATGLSFELLRMQEGAAVREILESRLSAEENKALLVVLGDRNSGSDSASTAILSGERALEDFTNSTCEVERDGQPHCRKDSTRKIYLQGLFAFREQQFPGEYRGGTHKFQGHEEYLDEVFLRPSELSHVLRPNGKVRIGTEGDYFKGSDHKLVWAELDLS